MYKSAVYHEGSMALEECIYLQVPHNSVGMTVLA